LLTASHLLQRVADKGINVAQYNLAVLYEGYPKRKPNYAASLKWYKKACENNYQRACSEYQRAFQKYQDKLELALNESKPGKKAP